MSGVATEPNTEPLEAIETQVDQIYRHRFPQEMLERRAEVWKVLCSEWFGRYIPPQARVLEIAAGYCEFINNIAAGHKVAIDLNPDTRKYASSEVEVHEIAAELVLDVVPAGSFDAAFMSNFLEHCRTRDQMLAVLRACSAALKPGGRLLILGPNWRYCYREYYDYFDHHLALSEKAVVEALQIAGFEMEVVEAQTLPYTFRSRLPSAPWLVSLYLRMPFIWRFFGAQFFLVARRPR